MKWVLMGLVALSPAILYGIGLLIATLVGKYYRRPCLTCGQRGLKCVNFITATIKIDGRRAPDYWSYYRCDGCGAAFKLHHGVWSAVPDGERHFLTDLL